MASKQAEYELSELLNDVSDKGFVVLYISKLWRLLGKGNRAAGTWKALLDAWEESREGNKRNGLYICQMQGDYMLISKVATERVEVWAGEA